jgi:GT2 family glycosyltransferase
VIQPELSAVVVAWRAAADVAALAAAWPDDERFELVIVDQSGDVGEIAGARVVRPGRNLGFAAGSNLGARTARAGRILFLNPDARIERAALEAIAAAFDRFSDAAGIVPKLVDFDGAAQTAWQLRRLPSPLDLLAHAFFFAPGGAGEEPPEGAAIEQPAAAALALARDRFEAIGGFDEGYFPAWWEDVDLARRLQSAGLALRYLPGAVIRHRLGGSVDELGYRAFLLAYDRNLLRYLRKHHGGFWAAAFRVAACAGAIARILLLPVRKPARAASRRQAMGALFDVALGSLDGWKSAASAPGGVPA